MTRSTLSMLLLGAVLLGLAGPATAAPSADAAPAAEASFASSASGVVLGPFASLPASRAADPAQSAAFARGLGTLSAGEDAIAAEAFGRLYEATQWPEVAYNAALSWYRAGRYDIALPLAQAAGKALRSDLRVGYLEGVLLQTVGRYRDAKALMVASLARAAEFDSPFHLAVAQLNLGASSRLLGLPEDALDAFSRAQSIGEQAGMPGISAAALMGRGRVLLSLGDRASAETVFARARKLGKRSGFEAAEADSVLSQAALALSKGQTDKAARLLDTALTSARGIADRSVRASLFLTGADLRRMGGRDSDAQSLLAEAEKLFAASGVAVGEAHCAQLRGAWAREAGQLDVADRQLSRALAIQARFQVPLAEAETHRHLGLLRADQGRFDEGQELVLRAVLVFANARAVDSERGAQIALADVLWRAGKLGPALEAILRALALAELAEDGYGVASIRAELAVLQAAGGDPAAAAATWALIGRSDQAGLSTVRRGRYHIHLAEAERRSGRAEAALASAQTGLDWAQRSGEPELLTQAHQAVALALSDLGRSEDALAFLERQGVNGGELLQNIRSLRAVAGYNEGVRAIEAGDYPLAIARFSALAGDPLADAERRETAQRSLQSALGLAAQHETESGRPEAAQGFYERALAVAQDRKDLPGQANIYLRLSVLRSGVEDPRGAADYAGQAAALADRSGDSLMAGQSWTMLGDLRFESDATAAQEAYRKALAAWGQDDTVLGRRANVAYNLAALEAHNGDPEAALAQFAEAKELAKRAGDQGLVARIDQVLQQLETE